VDPQHGGQRVGRPATFLARLEVVGLNQIDQCLPGHHILNLSEKLLAIGLLLVAPPDSTFGRGKRGGQLVIREAKLLSAQQSCPSLPYGTIPPGIAWVSQSLPRPSSQPQQKTPECEPLQPSPWIPAASPWPAC